MSREIKFRGKRIDNGEMVHGSLSMGGGCPPHYDQTRTFIEPNEPVLRRIEVHPGTVGEFAGLHDKNGVEIYEGDILKTHTGWVHEVKWNDKNCKWNVDYITQQISEVIGNIHEEKP